MSPWIIGLLVFDGAALLMLFRGERLTSDLRRLLSFLLNSVK